MYTARATRAQRAEASARTKPEHYRVKIVQNETYIRLMEDFIALQPKLWNEDIGRDQE